MPPGIDLSGVAIISSITWPAAGNRSASLALSSSEARADREEAAMAKPHKTTDNFLIIFCYTFRVHIRVRRSGPKKLPISNTICDGEHATMVVQLPGHEPNSTRKLPAQKNGGCRDSAGNPDALSTTPLPGLCC